MPVYHKISEVAGYTGRSDTSQRSDSQVPRGLSKGHLQNCFPNRVTAEQSSFQRNTSPLPSVLFSDGPQTPATSVLFAPWPAMHDLPPHIKWSKNILPFSSRSSSCLPVTLSMNHNHMA